MISSGNNPNIQRQQTEIAINTRLPGGAGILPLLPYDPQNPPDDDNDIQVIAPNNLDNSDYDFSKDDYINSPPVGGDASFECYNFYRQRFIQITRITATAASTAISSSFAAFSSSYSYPISFVLLNGGTSNQALVGTLTRVDDNNATLSVASVNDLAGGVMWIGDPLGETSALALKATGHSLFAANEDTNGVIPRWEKTNGFCEFGTDSGDFWDIATPLPINLIRGGLVFYFSLIVTQRDGAGTPDPVRLYAGIWDATTGRERFLESAVMDLDVSPVPTAAATTYIYKIIADLDNGTSIESDAITITDGPASLSSATYNRLTWQNATGILRFRIYRDDGATIQLIFTITNGGRLFSVGCFAPSFGVRGLAGLYPSGIRHMAAGAAQAGNSRHV
jgi:hypothetical protein